MVNVGMNLGIKIGSALRNAFSTENNGLIIAHRIHGRRRYTSKALINETELCEALYQYLTTNVDGLESCKVNPITGSVTVTYKTHEKDIDRIFDTLSHHLAGKHAQQEESILPSSVITVSDNINDTLRGARDNIRSFFNHTEPLFISRLVGVGLLVYGVMRMVTRGDRPAGPQLFWWGLGLLLRQSHRHDNNKF